MFCILTIIVAVFIGNHAVNSAECLTVKQGSHYPGLPFHGFNSQTTISTRVQLTNSSADYLFPSTDPQGHRCLTSWNKLWGSCRCGYFSDNHKDSDRFVFRRAYDCITFDSGYITGESNNCTRTDLVEIAAYAYDNGDIPINNQGRLLKEFKTKLHINNWYKLTLVFEETKTTYQLFDNNDQLLETQEIIHRQCSSFQNGMMQSLYFGGVCPAPQDVSVCYDKA